MQIDELLGVATAAAAGMFAAIGAQPVMSGAPGISCARGPPRERHGAAKSLLARAMPTVGFASKLTCQALG